MRLRARATIAAAMLVGFGAAAQSQSTGDLGAWAALMVSPFGALPPRVRSSDAANRRENEVSFRYGRWEYDNDDVAHNTVGLTAARELASGRAEVAVTGAYLSLQCGGCANWRMASAEIESTVWRRAYRPSAAKAVIGSVGARASVGTSRNSGADESRAVSLAVAVPAGLGLAMGHSHLDVALIPGFGYGRISGVDRSEAGTRSSIGAAAAWRLPSGFGIEVGIQRVFLIRGPSELGVGLSWGLGARDRSPP